MKDHRKKSREDCKQQKMADPEHVISDSVKRERSTAQMDALAKARLKAAEVRAKTSELRRKEREVVDAQLAENRRIREQSIERQHAEVVGGKKVQDTPQPPSNDVTAAEVSEEEEVVYERAPKKKKKRRVVVVQDSSDSEEEEIQVKLPKKRPAALPPDAESSEEALYRRTYDRMFQF